ncbi:MAG: hypothetical protein HC872_00135 [Gammaproteobacteria bacterium]|nr:hypothetical protein [Gammaproteobacteria bacterium]
MGKVTVEQTREDGVLSDPLGGAGDPEVVRSVLEQLENDGSLAWLEGDSPINASLLDDDLEGILGAGSEMLLQDPALLAEIARLDALMDEAAPSPRPGYNGSDNSTRTLDRRKGRTGTSSTSTAKRQAAKDRSQMPRGDIQKTALVSLLKSGRLSASSMRRIIASSQKRQGHAQQRQARVRDSFLSAGDASHATTATTDNPSLDQKPEVVKRALATPDKHIDGLLQRLAEARREWESRVRVMQALATRASQANAKKQDARLTAQQAGLQEAADNVGTVAGQLLLAQVAAGSEALPDGKVYTCR